MRIINSGINTPISAASSRLSSITSIITLPRPASPYKQPGDDPHNTAPHQTVDDRHVQFAQNKKAGVAFFQLMQCRGAHDHGNGLITGVAADAGDDGHQRRQRDQLGNGAVEQANDA